MRAFLLLFIAAWVGGVVLGVFEVDRFGAGVAAIGAALATFFQRWRVPYAAAVFVLVGAGWVWGSTATPLSSMTAPASVCAFGNTTTGTITRVHQRTGSGSQYVVTSEHGCQLLLTTSRFPEYREGTELQLQGEVDLLTDFPPEFAGYAEYLAQRGITATLLYPQVRVLSTTTSQSDMVGQVRTRVRRQIEQTFVEPEAAVVTAMLLGEGGVIPDEIDDQLRRTGISHIIAISGSHISLFVGMALIGLYLLPLPAWWRTGTLLMMVWGYIALVDFLPSATRAAFFWTITVLALQARALISMPTLIILTLAAMVSMHPPVLFDVGFQLSLAAVAGIGLTLFLLKRHWLQEAARKNVLSNVACISLGATAATWPLVAYHFGNISFVSILTNILVVPVTPLFMALALLSTLVSFIFPPAALILSFGVRVLWQWIEFTTRVLAQLPGAIVEDVVFPSWILPFYYLGLVAVAIIFVLRQGRSWREVWE